MATPTRRGTSAPQLQRYSGRYSPINGFTYDQEFRGLDPVQMQALASRYARAGCEYELTVQFGIATLRTVDTRGNVTIDTWEIGVSQQLVSSLKNPRNRAGMISEDGLTGAEADSMLLAIAQVQRGETTEAGATTVSTLTEAYNYLVGAGHTYSARLVKRITNGQDSYFDDQYTVRHSSNVWNGYPFNVADFNKNCIYTPAQFYSEAQSAAYWIFPMPNAFVNVLVSNGIPDIPANFQWGYLKGGSPRSTAANNRILIQTEYKQFAWSTDEYNLAS